jgi:hypothetical protein
VFTFELFDWWVALSSGELFVENVSSLIGRLSSVHAEVLQATLTFMRELIVHSERNGLSASFLASAFGPLLLRPPDPTDLEKHRSAIVKVVQGVLDNYAAIFFPSLSRYSDNTTQSTATDSTPRRTRKNPEQKPTSSVDEFAALAKLVAVSSGRGSKLIGKQTPDDSEEDRPESSSDEGEDEEQERAPVVVGRSTIRVKPGSANSSGNLLKAQQTSEVAKSPESGGGSLTDVDTHVLRRHIDELKGMSLKGEEEQDESEDSSETRRAKIEVIRSMLKNDPRFKSHTKVPSAKYEPAGAAVSSESSRRKKSRRKQAKKKEDVVVVATPPASGAAETPKKRRPKICAKCKEAVRGTKVRFFAFFFCRFF